MLSTSKPLELKNLKTGDVYEIHVRPMTLAMKSNLDEWLRGMYLRRMTEMGEMTPELEKAAENLDIVSNNFFVSNTKTAPRILWEISRPKMVFTEFEKTFFDVSFWDMTEDESAVKTRFETNMRTFAEAFAYAVRDPTKPAREPETPILEEVPQNVKS